MLQATVGGIAKRYAKALFEIAKENNIVEQVESDINSVWALLQSEKDLLKLLTHPMIPAHRKVELLDHHIEGRVNELVVHFMELLVRRGRIKELGHIISVFKELADEWRNVLHVEVRSAVELTEEELEWIKRWASQMWGKQIFIHARLDESLIGGIVIKAGDKLLDLSIRGAFDDIASYLKQLYVFQIGADSEKRVSG
ncbi:MAG: ATP synthase F1 subunit delta [Armatimonadota bacterium]|nr:ATP synthase F1 subunit delta [Armatimonadota bacterium]MCX7776560.1 ATP synthase F1 subunit delta [Armatimonadota bacterium]MDW8026106.1 ATP synthase F1 subunit delta [Armatimonadota bacterium]